MQKGLVGASLREIKEDLKLLLTARYRDSGFTLPRVMYTDMCCDDRQLLREILNELRDGGWEYRLADPEPTGPEQPLYEIPGDVKVVCIPASQQNGVLQVLCPKLESEVAANDHVMGLDIEWEVPRVGSSQNPPAVIQMAAGKLVVIFQVLHGQRSAPKRLPSSLQDLLENPNIVKAGVAISADCTRLRNFDVGVEGAVDLVRFARDRQVKLGRNGLADLCADLLGKRLEKETHVRVSKWNTSKLSAAQEG